MPKETRLSVAVRRLSAKWPRVHVYIQVITRWMIPKMTRKYMQKKYSAMHKYAQYMRKYRDMLTYTQVLGMPHIDTTCENTEPCSHTHRC